MKLNLSKEWFFEKGKEDEGDFNITKSKQYYSVQEMLEDIDPEFAEDFRKDQKRRRVAHTLLEMRLKANLSPERFAAQAGWTEEQVDLAELSYDEDITIKQILTYKRVCK